MLRLDRSEGTVWLGRGTLAARAADGSYIPHLPVSWRFSPGGLMRGQFVWQSGAASAFRGEVLVDTAGYALRDFAVKADAAWVFPLFPGTVAHAGWGGDLVIQGGDWRCSWNGRCRGASRVQWYGANSHLLAGRRLGDYEIGVAGEENRLAFEVLTLAGDFRVSGTGSLSGEKYLPAFNGRVSAPQVLLSMLPNVAAGIVVPDGQPGSLAVRYPAP